MVETLILVKKLMNTVPIIVPTMNSANIPLASGELNPYLSTTTATSGSRPMEFVKPIDSRLNPKSKAAKAFYRLSMRILGFDIPLQYKKI